MKPEERWQKLLAFYSGKSTAFWDTAPCSLVEEERRFRGAYYLHHRGDDGGKTRNTKFNRNHTTILENKHEDTETQTTFRSYGRFSFLSAVQNCERRMLIWIFGFIWLKVEDGAVVGSCQHGTEHMDSLKEGKFL
jgi:hypothetical protein